ncbi:MAG: hypothetical protein AAFY15_04000 [Cyanobacteria bacterium J06648_11]
MMVWVRNNGMGLAVSYMGGNQNHCLLFSGINQVPDAEWAHLKAHPIVQKAIETEDLEVLRRKPRTKGEIALDTMKVKEEQQDELDKLKQTWRVATRFVVADHRKTDEPYPLMPAILSRRILA